MHSWVAVTILVLLGTEAVVPQAPVPGVAGQSVMLPCAYSTAHGVRSMCWGRGSCSLFQCLGQLIRTDGYCVTFRKSNRYNLKGMILEGNLSLTIENAAQSDSGVYCCRVEHPGWFNDMKVNILLDVKPAPPQVTSAQTSPMAPTSAPTTTATAVNLQTASPQVTSAQTSPMAPTSAPTTTATAVNLQTAPPKVTSAPAPPVVFTSAPTGQLSTLNLTIGGNGTALQPSAGGGQGNVTHTNVKQIPKMSSNKASYMGLAAPALALLTILVAVTTKKCLHVRRKVFKISKLRSRNIQDGTSQKATAVHYQAEENLYLNSLYTVS